MKPQKTCYKGEKRRKGLRKRNTDVVNLINEHYMHIENIAMKCFCTINMLIK
jgi:hypothetical protein